MFNKCLLPESKKRLIQGSVTVMGAFLLHLTYGHFYTIANMVPYIMGYLNDRRDQPLEHSLAIWLSAIALGVQGIAVPLGGITAKKLTYRFVLVVSCLMESGGVILTYFTIQKSFLATVLTYSLMKGAGFSFGYSVVLAVASAWFPERKGFVIGLIVGGFGLGALIFTPIQTAFINPNNIPVDNVTRDFTDKRVLEKVPSVFLLLGTVLLSMQCIGLCMIRKDKSQPTETQQQSSSNTDNQTDEKNLSPKEIVREVEFYLLWMLMFCSIIPITLITASYKRFGQNFITNDQYLTAVATSSSVFNFLGRIMWGSIVDKISFKLPFCTLFSVWALLLLTFPHLSETTGIAAKLLFAIWVCLIFVCISGVFTIMPVATSISFGPVNLAINYGMIYSGFSVGSILCATATYLMKRPSFIHQYTAGAIMCLVALFTVLWINDPKIPPKFDCFKPFTKRFRKGYENSNIETGSNRKET